MEELKDYSGEFNPNLKLEEFSKDTLVSLWYATCRLLAGLDGHWYNYIKEILGEEATNDVNHKVWADMVPRELRWIGKTMKIDGNDLEAFFKFQQVNPAIGGVCDIECDLKNKEYGTITFTRCPALDSCERHNWPGRLKFLCDTDDRYFRKHARHFNANIKVKSLKLPPRESKDEIACKWEFKIEPDKP